MSDKNIEKGSLVDMQLRKGGAWAGSGRKVDTWIGVAKMEQ